MPANRVTSASPWHIVLAVHVNRKDKTGASLVRTALDFLLEEMMLFSQGGRPLFRVSAIDGALAQPVVAAATNDVEAAALISAVAKTRRKLKADNTISSTLDSARKVLLESPGRPSDYTPFVVLMTAGPAWDKNSATAAENLKTCSLAAGCPQLVVFDFSPMPNDQLAAIASAPNLYRHLKQPADVAVILPTLAPIGGSARADISQPSKPTIRSI